MQVGGEGREGDVFVGFLVVVAELGKGKDGLVSFFGFLREESECS